MGHPCQPGGAYATVVLAVGSNDPDVEALEARFQLLRAGVTAQRVVWVLPYHRRAAALARAVAARNGDWVIDMAGVPAAADGVHPRSYAPLAVAAAGALHSGVEVAQAAVPAVTAESRPAAGFVTGAVNSSVLVFR